MSTALPARRTAPPPAGIRARVRVPVAAAPRPSRMRRLLLIASFLLVVVVPGVAAVVYFAAVASSQYLAEAQFTVRPAAPPGGLFASVSTDLIVQNTLIVMSFLQSRALLDELDRKIGLRQLYDRDSIDAISRLKPDAAPEALMRYWKGKTSVAVQATNGIITLKVRAFSPDDAVTIATACLKASQAEVNRLDQQAVTSTLAAIDVARKSAETRLAAARTNLETTRNREAVIDSDQSEAALTELITKVRNNYLQLQQQADMQRRYLNKTSPQLRNLEVQLQAARHEIARLEAQQTTRQNTPAAMALSDSLAKVDYAALESKAAETRYAAAIAQNESAQLLSSLPTVYVEVFSPPTLAQDAKYPHRVLWSFGSVAALFAAWLGLVFATRQAVRWMGAKA